MIRQPTTGRYTGDLIRAGVCYHGRNQVPEHLRKNESVQTRINIIILMGVAGCGKNAVGEPLAERLGVEFFDGDDFHSPEARQQMDAGKPLTEAQRIPWRQRLEKVLDDLTASNTGGVLACSCLSRAFRKALIGERKNVLLVYLKADFDAIRERLEKRTDHYFKADLLRSQFDALEEPGVDECLQLDASGTIDASVERVIAVLNSAQE